MKFSICCIARDESLYRRMKKSFDINGFSGDEWFTFDNTSENRFEPYGVVNAVLRQASGEAVIFVHDDVALIEGGDDRRKLEQVLRSLEGQDDHWAVASNAGVGKSGIRMRVSSPHHTDWHANEEYPYRVDAVDEHFLVVRRDANIGVSHDMDGFHMWAADLCMHARLMGCSSYVVDFHVWHGGERIQRRGLPVAKACGGSWLGLEHQAQLFADRWGQKLGIDEWKTTCATIRFVR
jgi:hypothetical protein